MAGTIEKIKAKVENVLHHDNAHSTTGTTGTAHTTGATGTTRTTSSGLPEGTAGPHTSRAANAADPRVDSDRDNRAAGVGTGVGSTGHHSGATGAGIGPGVETGPGIGSGAGAGPHSSNLANKMDPRVDSTNATNAGTTGYGGTHAGNNQGAFTGTTGGLSHSTNAGPHNSNLANKADPRVDSDLDGRGNRHGAATGAFAGVTGASGSHATPGSGVTQNTAGPHNSDLANKVDPRVDADLDGSTTLGGNRTRADTNSLDASKVPPSVFVAHKGEPEVLHRHPSNEFAGRHGNVVSDQNQLSGV
ncbi:hypothetical protein D0Z07_9277 [Hyphodiscus hymeniophilus]|uniref:Uncharacterized protein n=1 Tax=Hyphodiscus hymeniophilus TaxID=353542 RepID=A0A9P6VDH6_9HELO|nr:hypothetical protein D0Z07_9277 [Hyphodiscus hymeniophilus]